MATYSISPRHLRLSLLALSLSVSLFVFHLGCAGPGSTAGPTTDGGSTTTDGGAGSDKGQSNPDQGNTDGGTAEKKPTTGLTWYKNVQPIIQENCQNCHFKGGVGPFPLTTYEEVKAKADLVKWSVSARRMPPWMPDDKCLPLKHARNLTQLEIDTIKDWVEGKTPKGDPKDGKTYTPTADKLDWTDSNVDIQVDYTPPANNPDDYHCFLTKPVTKTAKELIGFQLKPGVREMVHHVLIYAVRANYAATLSKEKKGTHWRCSTGALFNQRSLSKTSLVGVWVPGTDVIRFPQNTGMPLQAGDHLVLETHFNLTTMDKPLPERTKIQLQFAKKPVKYKLQLALQFQPLFAIPSKSKNHPVTHTLNIPAQVRVWGFMPHMHKYGTKFNVQIKDNSGKDKGCLVNIKRWDYNWQQTYFFKDPQGVTFSPQTKLNMTCTFDNPTNKTITWGDRTEDEMCLNFYFISTN